MNLLTIHASDAEGYDAFVAAQPRGHLLQSYQWGAFKSSYGWTPQRLAISSEGRLVGAVQVLFKERYGLTVAYVPRGPVIAPDAPPGTLPALLKALDQACRRRRTIFLRMEPNVEAGDPLVESLLAHGYRKTTQRVQPGKTITVDIRPSLDQIMANMKNKTRYNMRLAERRGVKIHSAGPEELPIWYAIMEETRDRDEFGIHDLTYYRDALNVLRKDDHARLFIATFEETPVAGIMVFSFGPEAIYMYGASSNQHRQHMPSYLVQWEALKWAKERGCSWYDLWGVPESAGTGEDEREEAEQKNVRGGLWGVYRFKQGFGGRLVTYAGTFDRVYLGPLYKIWMRTRPPVAE